MLVFVVVSFLPQTAAARSMPAGAIAREQQASSEASQSRTDQQAASNYHATDTQQKITAYTLAPDALKKAKALSRTNFISNLVDFFYGLFILWFVLHWKLAPKFRDWAEKTSSNRLVQAFIFTTPLILTLALLDAPSAIYEHTITLSYGLSVEGWGALALDFAKGIAILILIGSFLTWILYAVIRKSPQRWMVLFLARRDPDDRVLVLRGTIRHRANVLPFRIATRQRPSAGRAIKERVVQRSGESIAPDRMFWMRASEKTPLDNAYVTGLGASKRIVVWDTTINNETTPEIVSVVGHEMGHYVLGHVWKGLIFSMAVLFVLLYAGYKSVGWVLARWRRLEHSRPEQDLGVAAGATASALNFQLRVRSYLERLQPPHRTSSRPVRLGGNTTVCCRTRARRQPTHSKSRECNHTTTLIQIPIDRIPILRSPANFRSRCNSA